MEPLRRLPERSAVSDAERPRAQELLSMLGDRRGRFLQFVRRRLGSESDAEDLLQQALVKAAQKIGTVQSAELLDAWFYRVLRNTIADHRVARARREAGLEALAREAIEALPADAAACACSLGILETLRAEYADILTRVDLDEHPVEAAAQQLGITSNNAGVRLYRARKAMREALLSLCGATSTQACQDCSCDEPTPQGGGERRSDRSSVIPTASEGGQSAVQV